MNHFLFALRTTGWYGTPVKFEKLASEASMLPFNDLNRAVDLHLHSTCSDGLSSPAELVTLARDAGLRAIALCDHDSIAGIDEALAAGEDGGLEVMTGVELSSMWGLQQDIHLLGYGFDHHAPALRDELAAFRSFRLQRNRRILERINDRLRRDRRTVLDFHDVQATVGGTVGRPHLARALVARGYARNVEDAFQRYLIPCNVPKRFFPLDQAIRLVHDCGGIAVLAHPLLVTTDRDHWDRLLDDYTRLGLDGIEVYTPAAAEADIEFFLGQARRRGLVVTGGSDFHGLPLEPSAASLTVFGDFAVPLSCLEELKAALRSRHGLKESAGAPECREAAPALRYATTTDSPARPTSSA